MPPSDRGWSTADRELVRPVLALYLGSDYPLLHGAVAAVLDALTARGWHGPGRCLPLPPERAGGVPAVSNVGPYKLEVVVDDAR